MPAVTTLRVVVAEEDFITREGTRSVLDSLPDVEIVAMPETSKELVEAVSELTPDAVIFSLEAPHGRSDSVEAALQLRLEHPNIGLIVLSNEPDPHKALELLNNGSAGFGYLLRKNLEDPNQLWEALRNVVGGGLILDPAVVDAVLQAQRRRENSRLHGVSDREHQVLTLMATGRNNAAIAKALVLSEGAVEKHINSIFRKLGLGEEDNVNQRVRAVLFFLNQQN